MNIRGPSSLELIKVMEHDGTIIAPDLMKVISGTLSGTDFLDFRRDMALIRFLSMRAIDDARFASPKRMTLMIGPLGEEAIMSLKKVIRPADKIYSYGRYWDAQVAAGVNPKSVMDGFYENLDKESLKDFFVRHGCDLPRVPVGMQLDFGTGCAIRQKILGDGFSAVWVFFGDGATAQGYFHESLNVASILGLPVIFVCRNNQWALSTRQKEITATKTYAEKALAYNTAFLRADGDDPLAVYRAGVLAREYAERMSGPILVELVGYRRWDHTTAVSRLIKVPPEEAELARLNDPFRRSRLFLLSSDADRYFGIRWSREDEFNLFMTLAGSKLFRWTQSSTYRELMDFEWITEEDEQRYRAIGPPSGIVQEIAEASYQGSVTSIERGEELADQWERLNTEPLMEPFPNDPLVNPLSADGSRYPIPDKIEEATCLVSTETALYYVVAHDERAFVAGEDGGPGGGANRATALHKKTALKLFPDCREQLLEGFLPLHALFPKRVINTPLCENAIVGIFGTGASQGGLRPIVEIQFEGFSTIAFDQIMEAAKEVQLKAGLATLPLVIRQPFGKGQRIKDHQTCHLANFANTPGLIIAIYSTVQDAFDMLVAASRSNRPVLFYEHLELNRPEHFLEELGWYHYDKEQKKEIWNEQIKSLLKCALLVRPPWQPLEHFGVRIAKEGKPKTETHGKSLTITAYGMMVYECLKAVEIIESEDPEVSIEVLDIRVLKPFEMTRDAIRQSVKKTGRIVTVQEEPLLFGTGAEIVASVVESPEIFLGGYIDAPPKRVGGKNAHLLLSKFVKFLVPGYEKIAEACREVIYEKFFENKQT